MKRSFYIHKSIGPGMLEKVYQTYSAYRLRQRGLVVEEEKPGPEVFEEVRMDCGYRSDLVVESRIIVDTKNIDTMADIHIAQLLTYLKFLELRYGLILNFRTVYLKDGIKRVLRGY